MIVVLREDWTISAYDSLLNLLWEKPIEHKAHELLNLIENYEISDISVNVYPISLSEEEGSYGVIVVGASMAPRKAGIGGKGKLMNPPADKNTVVDRAKAELEHFSIYTLNANNGDIIWCHDGLDVKAEQYSKSLPKYAFSLNIRDLITQSHHAAGLSDWTIFRQSLIDELPHYWGQPQVDIHPPPLVSIMGVPHVSLYPPHICHVPPPHVLSLIPPSLISGYSLAHGTFCTAPHGCWSRAAG